MSAAISSAFDAGNIETVSITASVVELHIRPDPYTELEKKTHSQWFYFRSTASHQQKYVISNAGKTSFPDAWPNASVCVSTDRTTWNRVKADYKDGALIWDYDHGAGASVYFAYFDPYDYERQLNLVARCASAHGASVRSLGQTLDGRELDCIEVGTGPLHVWAIHRQHPGESQASFFAEGLLARLLGFDGAVDGLAVKLRRQFTFHVVPNMNPDGSVRGHLRTNAAGANLNREWASTDDYEAPTLARSPEVYYALKAMDVTGVDAFVDVHGDEALPVSFISGAEGCACWGPRIKSLQSAFLACYARANPDIQAAIGYAPDAPLEAKLTMGSNQVAQRYDCLGVTLEMPFKDCACNLGTGTTFQGPRASAMGASFLDALAYVATSLRGITAPKFGPEDDYVAPVEEESFVNEFIARQEALLAKEELHASGAGAAAPPADGPSANGKKRGRE